MVFFPSFTQHNLHFSLSSLGWVGEFPTGCPAPAPTPSCILPTEPLVANKTRSRKTLKCEEQRSDSPSPRQELSPKGSTEHSNGSNTTSQNPHVILSQGTSAHHKSPGTASPMGGAYGGEQIMKIIKILLLIWHLHIIKKQDWLSLPASARLWGKAARRDCSSSAQD